MNIKSILTFCLLLTALISASVNASAENTRIGEIFLDKRNVFDSTQHDWFFAAHLANSFHFVTHTYFIEDELLFEAGDYLNPDNVYETERNLRASGLFSNVSITVDSLNPMVSNLYVKTQDRWSTRPSFLFGTGGNSENIGGRLEELNFLGTGTRISVEALHRTEHNTGWQGTVELNQKRFFRTPLALDFSLMSNKFRTEEFLKIENPYRNLDSRFYYGASVTNNYGYDFLYHSEFVSSDPNSYKLASFHDRKLTGWFSMAWRKEDRVFLTVLTELDNVKRLSDDYIRAYDNSGKFLMAFSSSSETYIKTNKLNGYFDEDLPVGGWGSAILGKIFRVGGKGEDLFYLAAQGERSYLSDNEKLYAFGQITGASSITNSQGKYTYQEFLGTAFYRFTDNFLVTSRIRQQTVWNWADALRQLVLDNEHGIRGLDYNKFSGDNRIIANTEFRFFPDWNVWIVKLGTTAFWDCGSAWRRGVHLNQTQWQNTIGFGFRIFDMKSSGTNGILRLDFAYNVTEKKFAGIVFSSDQLFSAFNLHNFRLPEVYGLEFDHE